MDKNVVIVDDNPLMRTMLKEMLSGAGFTVVGEADNGNDAVRLFRELKPDVMTMDVTLPDLNGLEVLKRIRDGGAAVVMITALNQADVILAALKAGAKDFITKPFDQQRVIQALERLTRA